MPDRWNRQTKMTQESTAISKGRLKEEEPGVQFVPFACREYVHMEVKTEKDMTGRELKEKIARSIQERGVQNIYKMILTTTSVSAPVIMAKR